MVIAYAINQTPKSLSTQMCVSVKVVSYRYFQIHDNYNIRANFLSKNNRNVISMGITKNCIKNLN